jgi:AcrR family transcriptional regulator
MTDTSQARLSWKERKKQDLREELVDVALRLYERSGCGAPSVDEIVQEVGVAKGTFYLHFPSKSDIIKAVLEREIAELDAAVGAAVESSQNFASDTLVEAVSATFGFFEKHRTMIVLLAQQRGLDDSDLTPETRSELRTRYRKTTIAAYERIIRTGMLQGLYREIDAHVAAIALYGIMVALLNETVDSTATFDGLCESAMEVFQKGVIRRGV